MPITAMSSSTLDTAASSPRQSGTLTASEFEVRLNSGTLDLPDDEAPADYHTDTALSHVFVADKKKQKKFRRRRLNAPTRHFH